MSSYDNWLAGPYEDALDHDQAYRDWCEANNLDPDADESLVHYDEEMEAQREEYEVETYLHNQELKDYEDGLYYEP